jgi:hypothetical protein
VDRIPLKRVEQWAVLYIDFVTILWGASMQYITKLATLQSQKSQSPFPQNTYKVMYPVDAHVWTVKIVLWGIYQNLQPYKVLMNK